MYTCTHTNMHIKHHTRHSVRTTAVDSMYTKRHKTPNTHPFCVRISDMALSVAHPPSKISTVLHAHTHTHTHEHKHTYTTHTQCTLHITATPTHSTTGAQGAEPIKTIYYHLELEASPTALPVPILQACLLTTSRPVLIHPHIHTVANLR